MAAPDWAPTADQVAKLSGPRTRGRASIAAREASELGEFTATTRPTLEEVNDFIEQACDDVVSAFGGRQPCTTVFRRSARAAARYRAAALVEARVAPETIQREGSAFRGFEAMYAQAIKGVADGVIARCPFVPDEGEPVPQGSTIAPSGRGRDPRWPVMGLGHRW